MKNLQESLKPHANGWLASSISRIGPRSGYEFLGIKYKCTFVAWSMFKYQPDCCFFMFNPQLPSLGPSTSSGCEQQKRNSHPQSKAKLFWGRMALPAPAGVATIGSCWHRGTVHTSYSTCLQGVFSTWDAREKGRICPGGKENDSLKAKWKTAPRTVQQEFFFKNSSAQACGL